MQLKRLPITFHNVLKMTDTCKEDHWKTIALVMRNFVVQNGLYTNAPAFYQVEDVEGERGRKTYTVYVPINNSVTLSEDIPMEFVAELKIQDALCFRVADPDTPLIEAYFLLDACAEELRLKVSRPFYHVCFDVFGEPMTDVIAPIIKDETKTLEQKDV